MSLAMTKEERESFLAGLHVGIVSVARDGKGPLAVPIWYDYEPGGDVWMITGRDSLKGRLLKQAERISLCVQTETVPYQYASVEGRFEISGSSSEKLLHMATRYLGESQGKAYAEASGEGEDSIIVSFTPESWLTVDYGKR